MYKRLFVFCMLLVLVATSLAPALAQDGDTLTILYWQAASTMNPYLSGGTKDIEAGSMTVEPLAHFDMDGVTIVPTLVDEIPTVANGGVSEDLMSITWKLSEGIVWSDGTPLTSADVVFSWEYCVNPDAGCNALQNFADVENVEEIGRASCRERV